MSQEMQELKALSTQLLPLRGSEMHQRISQEALLPTQLGGGEGLVPRLCFLVYKDQMPPNGRHSSPPKRSLHAPSPWQHTTKVQGHPWPESATWPETAAVAVAVASAQGWRCSPCRPAADWACPLHPETAAGTGASQHRMTSESMGSPREAGPPPSLRWCRARWLPTNTWMGCKRKKRSRAESRILYSDCARRRIASSQDLLDTGQVCQINLKQLGGTDAHIQTPSTKKGFDWFGCVWQYCTSNFQCFIIMSASFSLLILPSYRHTYPHFMIHLESKIQKPCSCAPGFNKGAGPCDVEASHWGGLHRWSSPF